MTAATATAPKPSPAPPKPPAPRPPVEPEHDVFRWIASVSLATPGVRMVVVEAWSNDGVAGHRLVPVVALQASVVHEFSRPHRPGRPGVCSADPTRMSALGWHLDEIRTEHEAIVADSVFGLVEQRYACDGFNTSWQVVAAPWPENEDEDRLARIITEVEAKAIENERRESPTPTPAREETARMGTHATAPSSEAR